MMKVKKVYIKNFKGIRNKTIIDFSEKTTLLTGPNGFGKTTVFNILELCLTGKIFSTIEKDGVTNHSKDYTKPFFQNDSTESVVIKVLLEKENESLIIIKYLPKHHQGTSSGGRKNKPKDFRILDTYTEEISSFDDDEFIPENKIKLDDEQINAFFNLKQGLEVKNLFLLFNYLQQEEATFFLKMSEKERKDNLGFLFKTQDEEQKLEQIKAYSTRLKIVDGKLEEKISQLQVVEQTLSDGKFRSCFPSKEIEFDQEEPFKEEDIDNLNTQKEYFLQELRKLEQFVKVFSPNDFDEKQKREKLEILSNDDEFLEYYILKDFLEEERFQDAQKKYILVNNQALLKSYILNNHISDYKKYQELNAKISKYNDFLNTKEEKNKFELLENIETETLSGKKTEFNDLKSQKRLLEKSFGEVEKIIDDLIDFRNETKEKFEQYRANKENENDTACPFCGYDWENYEYLIQSFNSRTENFQKYNEESAKKIEQIKRKIRNDFIKPITKEINDFLAKNKRIDDTILYELEISQNKKYDYSLIEKSSFIWGEIKSFEELELDLKKLQEELFKSFNISNELFQKLRSIKGTEFPENIKLLRENISNEMLNDYLLKSLGNAESLTKNTSWLKAKIEETFQQIKFDNEKAIDREGMYSKYFDSEKEKFNSFSTNEIERKKEYINIKYFEKRSAIAHVYIERKRKLGTIIGKVKRLKDVYSNNIKSYKKTMVEKIQIPFFLYTAKILQNYQQGMGIFIGTKQNDPAIRFYTDPSSDHDAMHHLSSGQLAVVALAFCLSVNKVYKISENLNFLAIDDPVQEMDALNIHSFIELIKHDFANDYQIIASTHDDRDALYMKYKLEKMNPNSVKLINVQKSFFGITA